MLPKLILTDIDGVWTDSGMYYSDNGVELKKFNTKDSAGVLFCQLLKIQVGIITGEDSKTVKQRAKKLKIDHLFLGVKNKRKTVEELLVSLGLNWNEIAYLGDDINDIELLKKSKISATPYDAPDYIQKHAKFVLKSKGGEGVFREFIEHILGKENIEKAIGKYLLNINNFSQ